MTTATATPEDRQRARERAADAIDPIELVSVKGGQLDPIKARRDPQSGDIGGNR